MSFKIDIIRSTKIPQIIEKLKQSQNMNVKVGILDDPKTAKYASCVEYGWTQRVTPKQSYAFRAWWGINLRVGTVISNPPRPFLRGTLYANEFNWALIGVNSLIRSDWNMERALAMVGQVAGQDVQTTISGGGIDAQGMSFPIRSEFTMHVYNLRGEGHINGTGNINTVKPMVLTGNMLGSITYRIDRG